MYYTKTNQARKNQKTLKLHHSPYACVALALSTENRRRQPPRVVTVEKMPYMFDLFNLTLVCD